MDFWSQSAPYAVTGLAAAVVILWRQLLIERKNKDDVQNDRITDLKAVEKNVADTLPSQTKLLKSIYNVVVAIRDKK